MLIIDPMHNLFLGTGKRMLNIWLESRLLSSSQFRQTQECVDSFIMPSDVGRIHRSTFEGIPNLVFRKYMCISRNGKTIGYSSSR